MNVIIFIIVLLLIVNSIEKLKDKPFKEKETLINISKGILIIVFIRTYILTSIITLASIAYIIYPSNNIFITIKFSNIVNYIGLITAFFFTGIRMLSYKTLGINWSDKIEIYKYHSLIKNGPYKYVRHPIYICYLMIAIGIFFATGLWISLILGLVYFSFDIIRSKEEEKLLIKNFGLQYTEYQKRVGKFIPIKLQYTFVGLLIFTNFIGALWEMSLY
jgi:protein-S-isoprenylcysteine O-methyltransferase Ste14